MRLFKSDKKAQREVLPPIERGHSFAFEIWWLKLFSKLFQENKDLKKIAWKNYIIVYANFLNPISFIFAWICITCEKKLFKSKYYENFKKNMFFFYNRWYKFEFFHTNNTHLHSDKKKLNVTILHPVHWQDYTNYF